MKAIVLSGGGSKGSYQIGVWKALRKLNIKYDIVTGTSVGALNGALMTQKTYFRAIRLWKKINMHTLFGDEAIESENNLKIMKMYKDNFIKYKGTNPKGLEELINKEINKNKFYKSKINYGLITFDFTSKKPLALSKKSIPKNKLTDYLIASASCYPAFKKRQIDDKNYIDGGIYDNLPVNLAIKLGADEIICIDLKAPGIKQKPIKNIPTIKISPNNKLTNFLNFYEKGAKKNIKFGYNDTMKVFKKLEGKKYTFKKYTFKKLNKKYYDTYSNLLNKIIDKNNIIIKFKNLINSNDKENELTFLDIIENLCDTFEIEEEKIYSYKKINKLFKKYIKENKTDKKIKRITNIYNIIKENDYKQIQKEYIINTKEFYQALYLYVVNEV